MKIILTFFLLTFSSLIFARGIDTIYSCNDGEVKMTRGRSKYTLESNKFGHCSGYVNVVGGSSTTILYRADLGSAACNRGLTIEWELPVDVVYPKMKIITVTSKAGTELLECILIQQGRS